MCFKSYFAGLAALAVILSSGNFAHSDDSEFYKHYGFTCPDFAEDWPNRVPSSIVLWVSATPEDGTYVSGADPDSRTPASLTAEGLMRAVLARDVDATLAYIQAPDDSCPCNGGDATASANAFINFTFKDVMGFKFTREIRVGQFSLLPAQLQYKPGTADSQCWSICVQHCATGPRIDLCAQSRPIGQLLMSLCMQLPNCAEAMAPLKKADREYTIPIQMEDANPDLYPAELRFDGANFPEGIPLIQEGVRVFQTADVEDPSVLELLEWYVETAERLLKIEDVPDLLDSALLHDFLSRLSEGSADNVRENVGRFGYLHIQNMRREYASTETVWFVIDGNPFYFIVTCPYKPDRPSNLSFVQVYRSQHKGLLLQNVNTTGTLVEVLRWDPVRAKLFELIFEKQE